MYFDYQMVTIIKNQLGSSTLVWELISFTQGRNRRLCLNQLADGPKTPSMISNNTKEHLSHISRALRELSKKGLVVCVTPKASKNRIYRITKLGSEVISQLNKIEKKIK